MHFLAQLHTLALCHFMAHYHFSSAEAQEVLLSMRSIHATFLLRTSEHFTAVLSHNLMNVTNSCFFHQIINKVLLIQVRKSQKQINNTTPIFVSINSTSIGVLVIKVGEV